MRERKKASYTHAIFFQLMIIYFALCKVEKKNIFLRRWTTTKQFPNEREIIAFCLNIEHMY